MVKRKPYSERLFKGWQSLYHNRRFYWIQKKLKNYDYESLIEIGCFNARLLNYIKPKKYYGFDAGYEKEDGVDIALKKYKNHKNIEIKVGDKTSQITNKKFDVLVSLETFEHIEPNLVEPFLEKLSKQINKVAFFSVPVERGLPFLIATFVRIINRKPKKYTISEFFNSIIGRMDKVDRKGHKGFDERIFIKQVNKYFNVKKVESMFGPKWLGLNLGIGIIAVPKK